MVLSGNSHMFTTRVAGNGLLPFHCATVLDYSTPIDDNELPLFLSVWQNLCFFIDFKRDLTVPAIGNRLSYLDIQTGAQMKEFRERVAVVTGAASGIGRAMAETFIHTGMKVVLSDVDESRLENTVRELKDKGADVLGVPADVSKADQVADLADKTVKAYGVAHVLCNNAGVACNRSHSWEIPASGWEWVFGVNLMGVIHGIQSFLPMMLEKEIDGHIVNTASLFGLVNNFRTMPYCVSKHAVIALSENLHMELEEKNAKVKVSVLCPGPVNTDIGQSPEKIRPQHVPPPPDMNNEEAFLKEAFRIWLQRGLAPEDVARQVLDAIRDEQFYIITHDDANPIIEDRVTRILNRENPVAPPPPKELVEVINELMNKA